MKTKYLAITVVVLFILAGLAWWRGTTAGGTPSQADSLSGKPLVESDLLKETTWIEVSERDGPSVVMIEEGDRWVLPEYYGIPVDFDYLSRFTRSLREGKIDRFVTSNPERLDRLDLGGVRVALKKTGGALLWEMEVGKGSDSGGLFIGLDGQDGAYLTQSRIRIETTPANWASKKPLQIDPGDISSLTLPFADGSTLRLRRAASDERFAGDDVSAAEKLNHSKIDDYLLLLTEATYREIVPADDPDVEGAKENARRIHFTTFDGYDYTVSIGRRPGDPAAVAATEAGSGDSAAISSSIIFDSDGNIVNEDEVAARENGTGGHQDEASFETLVAEESDPKAGAEGDDPGREPGPVFAFFESTDPKFTWSEPQSRIALQFADYLLEELPPGRNAVVESRTSLGN